MATDNAVNILLVDDRAENLLVLEATLRNPRYNLLRATSGKEALEQLAKHDMALILLDVQMPEMDGFETAQQIKRHPRQRDIPIIFITAIDKEPVHVFRGYDSGAIDYLMKPFDDYVLRSKVAVLAEVFEKNRQIQQHRRELVQANAELQKEIWERKCAEEALARLAAIVESSDDAIYSTTIDGMITSWNGGAERLFGYTAAEMQGRSRAVLLAPDRIDEIQEMMARITQGERVESVETVRVRKDGAHMAVSMTVSPIKNSTGRIVGASVIARDITERRALEKAIIQISEREQQRIGQDLHDGLCQQLTGIALMCQALEQKLSRQHPEEAGEASQIAGLINQAIGQTRELVKGLYPMTQETDGLLVALDELVTNAESLTSVSCRLTYDTPLVISNPVVTLHLYRIVQEAVNNAIRHGKAKHVLVDLTLQAQESILRVQDDGVGFPVESREKPRGGMGLRIMRHRANMIGAALTIQQNSFGGTTVKCAFHQSLKLEQPAPVGQYEGNGAGLAAPQPVAAAQQQAGETVKLSA